MQRILVLLFFVNAQTYCQEHARILSSSTTYLLDENQNAEITEHYRIKILSEKGHPYSVFQEYFDQFKKITDITITVYNKENVKVKKLKRGNGVELGLNPSNEISDAKVLIIDPEYKQYPFTIEVHSTVKLSGFTTLPEWVPRPYFNIGVDHSEFVIDRPEGIIINLREQKISGENSKKGNRIITTYSIKNLPHIDKKIRYTDFYDAQPKVLISPLLFKLDNLVGSTASWKDFGNWFLELNDNPYELDAKTLKYFDGLDKTETKNLIKSVYQYMQDKTRYVSIQLGIGGFKSIPTEKVEKYGYGDCKALTTYMKNMLDYLGIKSNYVLVRAGKDVPDIIENFPSNQFNHVFLGVPMESDTILLECTSQIMPTDYIGTFTDDRNVLWIAKDNSTIIKSRRYSSEDNLQKNKAIIKLDNEGNSSIEINSINQGVFFDEIMIFKSAPEDYIKHYNQEKFNYSDFSIQEFTYNQTNRTEPTFDSRYVIQVNGMAKKTGEKLILPNSPLSPIASYLEKDELMKFYSVKRGLTISDEIEILIPSKYIMTFLPEVKEINSQFGRYRLSTEFDGEGFIIKRLIILYKGDYYNDGYKEFDEFFKKIEGFERTKLILTNKT